MNRSAEQTNRVNREAFLVRFVCSTLRFISHEPRKKSQFTRFVCSALRIISHKPRKKDNHSLYLQCLQQRPLLKFSEQSKKFKFPAEIGHLTLFQDKTILAYSFRQNSAGSCRRFCRLFISILNKSNSWEKVRLNLIPALTMDVKIDNLTIFRFMYIVFYEI